MVRSILNRDGVNLRAITILVVAAALFATACTGETRPSWQLSGSIDVNGEAFDLYHWEDQIRVCQPGVPGACVAGTVADDTLEMAGFGDGLVLGILGIGYGAVVEFTGTWSRQAMPGAGFARVTFFVGHSSDPESASFRFTSDRWGSSEGTVDLVDPDVDADESPTSAKRTGQLEDEYLSVLVVAADGLADPSLPAVRDFYQRHGIYLEYALPSDTAGRGAAELDPSSAVLVDFADASQTCELLATLPGAGEHDVTIVLGGLIRSSVFGQTRTGIACGGWAEQCGSWATPAVVAVDVQNSDMELRPLVLAHEIGHVLGLRHQTDPQCIDPTQTSDPVALQPSPLYSSSDSDQWGSEPLSERQLTDWETAIVMRSAPKA